MTTDPLSLHSIQEANRDRSQFSDEENAAGAAGKAADMHDMDKEPFFIAAGEQGLGTIRVGLSWDRLNVAAKDLKSIAASLLGKNSNVDLDLGCLYELKNGEKGCLQAFGDKFGTFDAKPYIALSGDERTGKSEGIDESFTINGAHWNEIERILIYAYIYKGVANWSAIRSHSMIDVLDRKVFLDIDASDNDLPVCALLTLENKEDGLSVTRRVEYFAGHLEMDRAYGYGLKWEEGSKE